MGERVDTRTRSPALKIAFSPRANTTPEGGPADFEVPSMTSPPTRAVPRLYKHKGLNVPRILTLDLCRVAPVSAGHEGRRHPLSHHLARRRRHDRPGDRPDPAAAPVRGTRLAEHGRRRARHPHHDRARRAPDR